MHLVLGWNRVDKVLRTLGGTPTRADRCTYVFYDAKPAQTRLPIAERPEGQIATLEAAMDYLTDPVAGSPSRNKKIIGVICPHVDDLFCTGAVLFRTQVLEGIRCPERFRRVF